MGAGREGWRLKGEKVHTKPTTVCVNGCDTPRNLDNPDPPPQPLHHEGKRGGRVSIWLLHLDQPADGGEL